LIQLPVDEGLLATGGERGEQMQTVDHSQGRRGSAELQYDASPTARATPATNATTRVDASTASRYIQANAPATPA
jgi:hypothetical protein